MTDNWEIRPPSKITVEFMTDIKATMLLLQNNLENLTRLVTKMEEENKIAHKELNEKIEKKINDMENYSEAEHKSLGSKIEKLEEENDCYYVSKEEFKPIRAIVYGMVGSTLTAILIAGLALVLRN